MDGDINDINRFRKPGDPTPEEVDRIVTDIMKPYAAKHKPTPLSDTELAVVKGKTIHIQICNQAQAEQVPTEPFDEAKWRSRLMEAYRVNFNHHLSKEEMVELLSVMHTEITLELLR